MDRHLHLWLQVELICGQDVDGCTKERHMLMRLARRETLTEDEQKRVEGD